eukprot:jgi/Picre1/32796/NNA_008127.t1
MELFTRECPISFTMERLDVWWNVTKRAVGVELLKQVNGRYIKKRIHVRVEHVKPSRCHEAFLRRCKENDERRHKAHLAGEPDQ